MLTERDCQSPLAPVLEEIQSIVHQAQILEEKGLIAPLEKVQKLLVELNEPTITVSLIGGANAGKSSLINQLLGRSLLPTSAISDRSVVYISSSGESADGERFASRSKMPNWHPMESFDQKNLRAMESPVLFSLEHDWLRQHHFCLAEMPPLNVGDRGNEKRGETDDWLISFTLAADCLLLITEATAPMRRNEVKLLKAIAQQSIPTVVVINKSDQLLPEEQPEIIAYVNKFVAACDSSIPVVMFSDRLPNTPENIQTLKDAITASLGSVNLSAIRTQRAAYSLSKILDAVALDLKFALESTPRNTQDDDIRVRQHQIDTQNLEWQRIKQKLNARRRKVDTTLTAQLRSNHAHLLDGLIYELETVSDVSVWWQRDFTARLAQEIQQTAEQVTVTINQQAIADIEWLQAEVKKQFDFPLEDFEQPNAQVNAVPTPPKSLVISDENMLNIISRIGSAAAAILTQALSRRWGYRNAEMAAGAMTGFATEQLILHSRSQEKTKIRAELSAIVKKVERAYISSSTEQLEDSYSQIVADLQHQQSRWQQAQAENIRAAIRAKGGQSVEELQQLLTRVQQLKATVKSAS